MIDIDPIEQADAHRISDAMDASTAKADKQRMQAVKREGELKRIASDLPDDAPSLWLFAEHSLTQSAISMIDAGRAFIKLKETLPHGEFQAGLKDRGIGARSAQKIMTSARRFADRSERFLKLGRTKLYACLEFSDDDLDALEDGESILDMDLDKMDRMTSRELRAAIQKRDADLKIKDQLLESKNKQIDAVAEENEQLKGHASATQTSPSVDAIESEKAQILIPMIRLRNRALAMEAALNDSGKVDRAEYFALQAALDTLRDQMAQAMDALYNAGAPFQASIASASLASE